MIRTFKSKECVEALEFKDISTVQEIIRFTGMGVTIDISPEGVLRSITLKNSKTSLVAIPGQFIYKNSSGTFGVCIYEDLTESHEEVIETETEE